MCIFIVHDVRQWPNLRHLAEPLGGAVGLLEAVSFKYFFVFTSFSLDLF